MNIKSLAKEQDEAERKRLEEEKDKEIKKAKERKGDLFGAAASGYKARASAFGNPLKK